MTPREVILELARERFFHLKEKEQIDFKQRIKPLLNNERAFFRVVQLLEGFNNQGPKKKVSSN